MFLYFHTNSRGLYSSDKSEICLWEDRFRTAAPIDSSLELGFPTPFVEVSKEPSFVSQLGVRKVWKTRIECVRRRSIQFSQRKGNRA